MTNEHPITPPPELVLQLIELPLYEEERLAAAYRAGADQELEACAEWFASEGYGTAPDRLRAARRPKPQSLKEQALAVPRNADGADHPVPFLMIGTIVLPADKAAIIRRAIEALPDNS